MLEADEGHDPHDLARFLSAQAEDYETALAEIRAGRKRSHWIWYIFPQIDGLGSSPTARRYAIQSLDEARAYLAHPVLGPRLVECAEAALGIEGGFPGFLDFTLRFRRDLGIPHTLDRIGVDDARLEAMAEMAAVDPTAGGNPRHLSPADALDLYRRALDGRLG